MQSSRSRPPSSQPRPRPDDASAMRRLLCAAILSAPLAPSILQEEDPWRAVGAFENDTWLPRSTEEERTLARADEAQVGARDEEDLNEIFSAWRAVLQSEASEGWVRWDTRVHWESATAEPSLWSERRVEGLSSAISLRIIDRKRALLPLWGRFISAEADEALRAIRALPVERLRNPLTELCYRYPCTQASVRAALLLSELDRELARHQHAQAWLSRAEHGARLIGDEALLSAVSARTEIEPAKQPEPWESTDAWEVVDFALLTDDISSPASGVRGLTRWNQGEVFIQSAELGWTLGRWGKDDLTITLFWVNKAN